jgi:hypothetical protein
MRRTPRVVQVQVNNNLKGTTMRMLKIGASIALLAGSGSVLADTYQFDLEAGYVAIRLKESSASLDVDTWAAQGTIYFSPVSTRAHPAGEAAFLERASNASVFIARAEIEERERALSWTYRDKWDLKLAGGGFEYYVPQGNMLYFGAELLHITNGSSDTSWSAAVGLTPRDGLRLRATYDDLNESWGVDGKFVTPVNGGTFVNLEAAAEFADNVDSYSVGGDYYFTRLLGFGAAVTQSQFDRGGSETEYQLRARMFFNERFSATAHVALGDGDGWGLTIGGRF